VLLLAHHLVHFDTEGNAELYDVPHLHELAQRIVDFVWSEPSADDIQIVANAAKVPIYDPTKPLDEQIEGQKQASFAFCICDEGTDTFPLYLNVTLITW
jgi:hypothetical protein